MLLAAAGCLLLASLVWLGAFRVEALEALDARVLDTLNRLDGTPVETVVELMSSLINPFPYALLSLVILGFGARAAGVRAALAAGVAILGANVTTQLLKRALAEQRYSDLLEMQIGAASWPSGHAAAATVALLAALLLASPRLRPAIAVAGGAWAAVVVTGVVINHWHYPSDAIGGVLVATAWVALAAWVSSRRPAPVATTARRRRWLRATG